MKENEHDAEDETFWADVGISDHDERLFEGIESYYNNN